MNKAELIDHVAAEAGITKADAGKVVECITDAIVDAVKGGGEVSIFGFGKFSQTSRAARTGRNPQTGEAVKIAASKGVKFAPAAAFKTALNEKAAKKAPAKKAAPAKKKG